MIVDSQLTQSAARPFLPDSANRPNDMMVRNFRTRIHIYIKANYSYLLEMVLYMKVNISPLTSSIKCVFC